MKKLFLFRNGLWVVSAASALAFFSGCSSSKAKNYQGDCKVQFDKLQAKYDKKKYSDAKDGFSEFITSCSGTEHAEQAYFELCESHFALEEWMEAEEEYSSFLKEFPSSRLYEEQARYRLAQSMANQVESPQRDQSKTLDAIREYETFLADFPDSPHADSAKANMDNLHKMLATRDMQVARLYRRMDEPLAAAIYYKNILREYGDRVPQREIILKLAECYIALEQFTEAESQLAQLDGVAKDDPFLGQVKAMQSNLEKAEARHAREKKTEQEEAKEAQKPRTL